MSAGSYAPSLGSPPGPPLASQLAVVSDAPFRSASASTSAPSNDSTMNALFKEPDYGAGSRSEPYVDAVRPARPDHEERGDRSPGSAGESLESLVDRLLGPPRSKADLNFPAIFLCLYRKFAAPGEVLNLVLRRFQVLDEDDDRPETATSAPLRHLDILAQWVTGYPGDFAHPRTRRRVSDLMAGLPRTEPYASAVRDMRTALEGCLEDDDRLWARSDWGPDEIGTSEAPMLPESTERTSLPAADTALDELESAIRDVGIEGTAGTRSTRVSGAPSNTSSGESSTMYSATSSFTLWNTVALAEREAQLLVPVPRLRLTKVQWRQFMAMRDQDVAEELTRIDWIMYSSVRPRDVVRQVSLPVDQKERCKSVENVTRMTNQFNHLAYWVTNMILLRDKPKHRAQVLEKFMDIAKVMFHSTACTSSRHSSHVLPRAEVASSQQLQLAGRGYRGHQWERGLSTDSDA